MFARFNRDYFGGRKPRYRVLRGPLRLSGGYCDTERRRILVRSGIEGDALAAILLHEMCHIGCPGHGRRFQDRIRRLIPLVPASVAAGLKVDLIWGPTQRQCVWSALDSLAMEYPATPWGQVRRVLVAHELPSVFGGRERERHARLLTWAKREWAKLSRGYLEIGAAPRRLGEAKA